jgi:6,7-dimethyl-8-ribityllumazine synthase
MSEPNDESQDWPLRDYSARLRPPGRTDEPAPPAPQPGPEFETEPETEPEPTPPPPTSEPEILYDEDDEPAEAEELPEAAPAEVEATVVEEEEAPAPVPAAREHAEGDFHVPGGYQVLEGVPDGNRRGVAIVVSRFNGEITNNLLQSALDELDEAGVARDAVLVVPVPGAFELPLAAMALAKTRKYACVVALGCVIRGETPHFDLVASEAASGLQLAGIETGVPVSFGLLTTDTREQAEARVERGAWAARTALEMADVFAQLRANAR